MNHNPYKTMYLVSEDEYRHMHTPKIHTTAPPSSDREEWLKEVIAAHNAKYMHEAPVIGTLDDNVTNQENKVKEMIDSYQFNVMPPNVRSKAHLLMTLVHQHGNVTKDNEFAITKDAAPVSGSNVFDLVNWAEKLTRGKKARPPHGWEQFVRFLSINKAIPRTILSNHTIEDIRNYESGKIKPVKVPAAHTTYFNKPFESLFTSRK